VSIIVHIYRNSDKIECGNYRRISLLSTTNKILSDLLSGLIPYAEEIIGDHRCGFRHSRSTLLI
jgi:hypothetical protein